MLTTLSLHFTTTSVHFSWKLQWNVCIGTFLQRQSHIFWWTSFFTCCYVVSLWNLGLKWTVSCVLRWLWPHKPLNSFSIGWYHSWILLTSLLLYVSSHLKQHFVPSAEENVLFNSPSFCHGHPLLTQLTGARRGVPQGAVWSWLPWSWKCYDKSFSFHSSPLLKVKRCSTLPFNHYDWPFPPFPAISSDSWLISCDTSVRLLSTNACWMF